MNEHDDVMYKMRESFSGLRMDMPVENVFAISRSRRRRRLSGLTATAAATAGAAAAITLAVGGPAAPTRSGNPGPGPDVVNPTPASLGPVKLAAFSVTGGPGDSTTLILRKGPQYQLDPTALRQALAQHGIPALVTVGTFCRPARGASANLGQVVHPKTMADGSDALALKGSAMPSGTRLSIGYFPNYVRMMLIKGGASLACSSTFHQPAAHITPSGAAIRG